MERPASYGAHIRLRLPVEPNSVAAAHHSVFGMASTLEPALVDDLRLLVSELVTNSLRHGRLTPDDWIDLELDFDGRRVRVEVRDPGPGFDPDAVPSSNPPDGPGWGLLFLRQIAARWGVDRQGRTLVWFELDIPPDGAQDRVAPRGRG